MRTLPNERVLAALWVALLLVMPAATRAAPIYFSDKDANRIYRVVPGQPAQLLLGGVDGLLDPRGVAVDVGAGKMYWAENGTRRIRRANLDGSGAQDLITTGLLGPSDIELDLAHGHLYWADRDLNQIGRSNLDGSGVTVVRAGAGVSQPYFLTLDVPGGNVYWTDFDGGSIHVARLDGAGPVQKTFSSASARATWSSTRTPTAATSTGPTATHTRSSGGAPPARCFPRTCSPPRTASTARTAWCWTVPRGCCTGPTPTVEWSPAATWTARAGPKSSRPRASSAPGASRWRFPTRAAPV